MKTGDYMLSMANKIYSILIGLLSSVFYIRYLGLEYKGTYSYIGEVAGILTILIGSLMRGRLLLPKRGSGGMILTLAMMQTVIQYTFFYIGLSHAPGFKGSIISPTSTFFALLIAALVFQQEKLTARKLLGCLIGFAGVVVVSMNGRLEGGVRLDGEGFHGRGLLRLVLRADQTLFRAGGPGRAQRLAVFPRGAADDGCRVCGRRAAACGLSQGLAADAVPGAALRRRVRPLVPAAAEASGVTYHGFLLPESGVRRGPVGIAAGGRKDPGYPALCSGNGIGLPRRLDRKQSGKAAEGITNNLKGRS